MTRDPQWQTCCKLIGTAATLTRIAIDEERTRSKPPDSWLSSFLRVCDVTWRVAALEHPPVDTTQLLLRSEVLEAYLQMRGLYPTDAATIWVSVRRLAWRTIGTVKDITENPNAYRYTITKKDLTGLNQLPGIEIAALTEKQIEYATKIWPFAAAVGRLPKHPDDDALLEAFEVALLADAHEFATHLARHGFGVVG